MPTLNWIGKEAVVNHHREVPFHLLNDVSTLAAGDPESGNLIVEGDNLVALKALLPIYRGQVKCIYIDPPYNTGKDAGGAGWVYNDKVASPLIREWLGKTVGKEGETLDRHDRWLCMMYPRLMLLKEFLAPDGVIFISIDDIELPVLRILMDEIFPHPQAKNRLACFVWETDGNFDNQAKIKENHEYILAYSRSFEDFPPPPVIDPGIGAGSKLFRTSIQNTVVKNGPKNPVSAIRLPEGFPASFESGVIPPRSDKWPHYSTPVEIAGSKLVSAVEAESGWGSKRILQDFIRSGFNPVKDTKGQLTSYVITHTGAIEAVKARSEAQSHVISVIRNVGSTQSTSAALSEMGIAFTFPKPVELISYLISMVADKNAIVLDSFAGSGTTGHAVLRLNTLDSGSRRFILIQLPHETEDDELRGRSICEELTAFRVKKIIEGYSTKKGEPIEGLGGGYRFCRLGDTLFNESGQIRESVKFDELAGYVYFGETGQPLPRTRKLKTPLLGVFNGTAIYLLFNGILGDKSANGGNVLNRKILASLPQHGGPKVVYCAGCLLGADRLAEEGITIRQTPYEIRVS